MSESQPWDNEPEIEDGTETNAGENEGETGPAGDMILVAVTLSAVVAFWAILGIVPRPVLYLAGLWIMAGTITSVAEVYAA